MSERVTAGLPADFVWGAATASYQVEGAVDADGRGPSIWDTFCRQPGKVVHGHTGEVSVDQYHRYPEDVALMRELGLHRYRFSLAWPRIIPAGSGKPNSKGFDYYNRLVDTLLEAGIQPAVTLYHWDLPQPLQDQGGWPARETALRFSAYAELCFRALSDRVSNWITLNEPYCSSILGYLEGVHAPGEQNRPRAYRAIHHLLLAHGLAVQAFRDGGYPGEIGISLNTNTPRPATQRDEDRLAAERAADLPTHMFLGPVMGEGYPERHLAAYPEVSMPVETGDMELIAAPTDFLGLNWYTEDAVAADPEHPEGFRVCRQYQETTEMGWPIVPQGFYRHLRKLNELTQGIPIVVTENGCAMPDLLSADGTRCHDPGRIAYLRSHIEALRDAWRDGVNVRGYYVWTLIDNFEWAYGFTKRFGLVYCDYVNQRRIPKDSFLFFRELAAGHE